MLTKIDKAQARLVEALGWKIRSRGGSNDFTVELPSGETGIGDFKYGKDGLHNEDQKEDGTIIVRTTISMMHNGKAVPLSAKEVEAMSAGERVPTARVEPEWHRASISRIDTPLAPELAKNDPQLPVRGRFEIPSAFTSPPEKSLFAVPKFSIPESQEYGARGRAREVEKK